MSSSLTLKLEPFEKIFIAKKNMQQAEKMVEVKAERNCRAGLETIQHVTVDESRLFFFDISTGERL